MNKAEKKAISLISEVRKIIPVEWGEHWGGGGEPNYLKQHQEAKKIAKIICREVLEATTSLVDRTYELWQEIEKSIDKI